MSYDMRALVAALCVIALFGVAFAQALNTRHSYRVPKLYHPLLHGPFMDLPPHPAS